MGRRRKTIDKSRGSCAAHGCTVAVTLLLRCVRRPDVASKAIGSSEQEHVVDALAMTGEEGRGSLR